MDVKLLTEHENAQIRERQALPEEYLGLSPAEMDSRIAAAKGALGDRLVILGHHYQRDEVIKFADVTGDSLKLSREAASRTSAEYIVFCGVHFMAESADILSAPHQQVTLPDLAAGCSMADMAEIDQLELCWRELRQLGIDDVVPVTYINSSAAIKGFVGEHGGVICTSSNAGAALRWAWDRAARILFLPDQHLGRNTAYKMGVPLDEMVLWDPNEPWGGLAREAAAGALSREVAAGALSRETAVGALSHEAAAGVRLILWKGHCSVHTRFTVAQIQNIRKRYPQARVIVHPECTWDVVQAADDAGSTEYILRAVRQAPAGTIWAVGTEIHLVNRLAREVAPAQTVLTLDQFGCLCSTMFRVSPNHLLWCLDNLMAGAVKNHIVVPEPTKRWARVALDRMLAIN